MGHGTSSLLLLLLLLLEVVMMVTAMATMLIMMILMVIMTMTTATTMMMIVTLTPTPALMSTIPTGRKTTLVHVCMYGCRGQRAAVHSSSNLLAIMHCSTCTFWHARAHQNVVHLVHQCGIACSPPIIALLTNARGKAGALYDGVA